MNGFVVFFAVIAVAAAGSVGRSTNGNGWGSAPVPVPSLTLDVDGALSAEAAGSAAAGQGSQAFLSGSDAIPAVFSGAAGTSGGVYQEGVISQQLSGSPNGPSGQTYGSTGVVNGAIGTEGASLYGSASDIVAIDNEAASAANGEGSAFATQQSSNNAVRP